MRVSVMCGDIADCRNMVENTASAACVIFS